ncbi:hypothetical protein QA942_19685 [Streptomyces sp. B21-106]|uniref:hypothetical protein n=1 Tax=Streptomyces sp. B21-106 TaxID=3039418 RepID=UPI002FEE9E94
MTTGLAALAILAAGYGIGRYQPAHRTSNWANRQQYDRHLRRHSPRWWAVVVALSADNIAWLITHPVQGWHAWQHRNDPPPPRSPAVRINDRPGPR